MSDYIDDRDAGPPPRRRRAALRLHQRRRRLCDGMSGRTRGSDPTHPDRHHEPSPDVLGYCDPPYWPVSKTARKVTAALAALVAPGDEAAADEVLPLARRDRLWRAAVLLALIAMSGCAMLAADPFCAIARCAEACLPDVGCVEALAEDGVVHLFPAAAGRSLCGGSLRSMASPNPGIPCPACHEHDHQE
ncbi:MAG: hypothetical protein H6705_16830 [Myxococcales bacterium]|nr:hypothetical protein [Myxococcales bacterium]